MKLSTASAFVIAAIGAASASAIADDRPAPKGPPKTMGDQGKLPASETMRNAVPDMTGTSANDASTGASSGTAGTGLRMGDEPGKLPATGTISGKVPEMRGPAAGEK
jgi:hypothetical protein